MPTDNRASAEVRRREAFCLGPWLVEPQLNRISASGVANHVEPKVMQVLIYLAERPYQVVAREELLEQIWADTIVGDGALTHSISKLRHALSDNPRTPQFIETISKTGYRLIAPVSKVYQGDSGPEVVIPAEGPTAMSLAASHKTTPGTKGLAVPGFVVLFLCLGGFVWLLLRLPGQPTTLTFLPPQPLTSLPGREWDAALSPNGHQVAFAWAGATGKNMDIYVKVVDEETPLRITEDPAVDIKPVWSPDGQRVAFLRYEDEACGIFITPVVGGSALKLADCRANRWGDLAWSPDGKWLAYPDRAGPEDPFSIYLLAVASLEQHKLTTPDAALVGDHAPAFSPDGKTLSFVRSVSLRIEDLHVVPLEGGAPQRLTFDERWIWGHTWTPDGEDLVFSSTRTSFFNLWRVKVRSGTLAWVPVTGGESLINPMISPKSQRLVYEQWFYDANIWQHPFGDTLGQDTHPVRLIASTQWDGQPQFSPDGRYVAFTSRRSGQLGMWVCKADGSDPVQLTATGNSFDSTMRWSPDGRRIVFSARQDAYIDLYIVNVEDHQIQRLTSGEALELNPAWSNDGRWIYFASDRKGPWQIWKMAANGGEAVQMTEDGGIYAVESPDGQHLYFARHHTDGLWMRSLAGRTETRLIEALASNDWGNWVVVDEGVYFIERSETGATLAFWDALTQAITPVVPIERTPMNPSLTISPDGQLMLYTRLDRNESDLMLVKDFH